jgi:hypothetical protein
MTKIVGACFTCSKFVSSIRMHLWPDACGMQYGLSCALVFLETLKMWNVTKHAQRDAVISNTQIGGIKELFINLYWHIL